MMLKTDFFKMGAQLLAVILAFTLVACGAKTPDIKETISTEPADPPAPPVDDDAPTSFKLQFTVNGNAPYTQNSVVGIVITAKGATEMLVSNNDICDGTNWVPFTEAENVTLTQLNALNWISVRVRDAAGLASECKKTSITHDDTAPTVVITAPLEGAGVGATVTVVGTCETSLPVELSGAGLNSSVSATCTAGAFSQAVTLKSSDGAKVFAAKQTDPAGNSTSVSRTVFKDSTGPSLEFASPAAGSYFKNSFTMTLSCETGLPVQVTNGASVADWVCANGVASGNLTLAAPDGTKTIQIRQVDFAGNETVKTRNFNLDTAVPALAFVSPAEGSLQNGSVDLVLSCETGLAISVKEASTTQSWTCVGGASSHNFPLSAGGNIKTVEIKQVDLAGNETVVTRDFTTDVTAPDLFWTSPLADFETQSVITAVASCESGLLVNIDGAGVSSATTSTCVNGVMNASVTLSNGDGAKVVRLTQTDAAGNSTSASRSFIRDNVAPVLTFTSPDAGGAYQTQVSIEVACETGYDVTFAGTGASASQSVPCVSGASIAMVLLSANEGVKTIDVSQTDFAGNVATASRNFERDNTPPSLTIAAPVEGAVVNHAGMSALVISGSCSEVGRAVVVNSPVIVSLVCVAGAYQTPLDLSSLGEGASTIEISHTDVAGNVKTVSVGIIKDSVAPSPPTLVVGSSQYTNVNVQSVVIASTDAAQMFLSTDAACAVGTWQNFVSPVNWTLSATEGLQTVYAKTRDAAGNETTCESGSITYDITAPNWTTAPTHANYYNQINRTPIVSWTTDASDVTSGVLKYQYAIGSGISGGAMNDIVAWTDVSVSPFQVNGLSLVNDQTYYVNMRAFDRAGNFVKVSSAGWTTDNIAPNVQVTSPVADYVSRVPEVRVSGSCTPGSALDIEVTGGEAASAPACLAGTFGVVVKATSAGSVATTVYAEDLAGNISQSTVNFIFEEAMYFNNTISAVRFLGDGSRVFGGSFTRATKNMNRSLILLNTNGTKNNSLDVVSGFNNQVLALKVLSDGSFLVGGDFTQYRGRIANRIAHISASGVLDESFNSQTGANGTDAVVRAIEVSGTDIFIGGDFTTYRGVAASRVAKLSSAGILNTTFSPTLNGTNGVVRALGIHGTSLFIGGDFTRYRNVLANRIAKVDATSGVLNTTFNPSSSASNGTGGVVRAIAITGNILYLSGDFVAYRSGLANRIAKVDAVSGAIDTTFNPTSGANGANGIVYGIALDSSGNLYIGGAFTQYRGSTAAARIAKVSSTGVLDTTFTATGANADVYAVSVIGGSLYLAGTFTTYKGATAQRIAKANLTSGAIDTTFNPAAGANGFESVALVLAEASGSILVGGRFVTYRPELSVPSIAKVGANWNLDTAFNPQTGTNGFNGVVNSIVDDGTSVFVGGTFTTYRGGVANRIAKINISSGAIDTTFNPTTGGNGVSGSSNTVLALAIYNQDLYIAGSFTAYRGSTIARFARVNKNTGVMDTTFTTSSGANNTLYAVAVDSSGVYIGGAFTTYRGVSAARLAKLNLTNGALNTTFTTGAMASSTVNAIALSNSAVYIGGAFTTYRGGVATRVAKLDPTSGNLNTTFNPATGQNGAQSTVTALAWTGTELLVTGNFTTYRGVTVNRIAKVTSDGVNVDDIHPVSGTRGFDAQVNAIDFKNGQILLGGAFTTYRGQAESYACEINSTSGAYY